MHWGKPPHTIDFTLFGVLDGQYLLRPILVYKPKDLNRDWPPQFSTLWEKEPGLEPKRPKVETVFLADLIAETSAVLTLMFTGAGTATVVTKPLSQTPQRACDRRRSVARQRASQTAARRTAVAWAEWCRNAFFCAILC